LFVSLNTASRGDYNDRKGGIPVKKLFCVVLLAVCFAVPAFAESAVIPADEDDLVRMIEESLAEVDFDYHNVTLNRKDKIIVIDVAFDDLTEQLLALKSLGFDETMEEWCAIKEVYLTMYSSIRDMFKTVHRDDMRLIFQIVNDDAFIHEDYSTIRYNPLLSIGISGMISVDVMDKHY